MPFSEGKLRDLVHMTSSLLRGTQISLRTVREVVYGSIEEAKGVRDVSDPDLNRAAMYTLFLAYRVDREHNRRLRAQGTPIREYKLKDIEVGFDLEEVRRELDDFVRNPGEYTGVNPETNNLKRLKLAG